MTAARSLAPLLLGAAYFVAALFAVLLTRFEGGVACLWIATAILAADLMSRPRRQWWPSILACSAASTMVTAIWGLGAVMAIPFTVVNITEAVVAAWLFRRFSDPRRPLGSLGWLLQFVVSVGIAAPLVAGLLGAIAAAQFAGLPFGATLMAVAGGHALGNLAFTPLALLMMTRANRRSMIRELRRRDVAEIVSLLMLAVVTSAFVFTQHRYPLLFLPILPMILIAFRLGRGGVAISIAVLALVGGLATASGQGPIQLVDASFAARMQFFQFYLAATVLTMLPVSADLANRSRLHRKLRESEAAYRLFADHSSDLILSVKLDGTIRYASPSCRQMGYRPDQLIGRNYAVMIAPEHLAEATTHFRSLIDRKPGNRLKYLARSASGEMRWNESHACLMVDEDGMPDGVLSVIRDIHAQEENEQKLTAAAMIDSLTGLSNRLAYREAVERRHPRDGISGACVAMLDIDHFKAINDRFGHDGGDAVLRGFAEIARRVIRDDDLVARIGGEEFALFFPDTTLPDALAVCDRFRSEVASTIFRVGTDAVTVTVSGGVAELGPDGIDAALKIADMALYRAKQAGRNQLALAA